MNVSKYQNRIIELLRDNHHLTLEAITDKIGADFSTVYRNVNRLLEDGAVRKISIDQKTTVYELSKCTKDHFICTSCNTMEPISIPREIVQKKHISDILVRGTCTDCTEIKDRE